MIGSAVDLTWIAVPLVTGVIAVVAIRVAAAHAHRREQARIQRLLKTCGRP